MHRVLFEQFVARFDAPPEELILDLDATDDRVHGSQVGGFFYGYYGDYCFLALYVFCGEQLLVSYLRPSNADGARHAWAVLALLVKALRKHWPGVRILLRADSGFCRWKMLELVRAPRRPLCGGPGQKQTAKRAVRPVASRRASSASKEQRKGAALWPVCVQGGQSWDRQRRVIAKAEHSAHGARPALPGNQLGGRA